MPGHKCSKFCIVGQFHYSIVIEWSPDDDDKAYVVILPEWADRYAMPVADGTTYEEAAARGQHVLENIVRFAREMARHYQSHGSTQPAHKCAVNASGAQANHRLLVPLKACNRPIVWTLIAFGDRPAQLS